MLLVPCDGATLDLLMLWAASEGVRRSAYVARHTACKDNVPVLHQLIHTRHQYATLLGFPSFTHYHLHAQFAQRPEFVASFLQELLTHLHPIALEEIKAIEAEKRADQERRGLGKVKGDSNSTPSPSTPTSVYEWDAAYYMGRIKATEFDLDDRTLSQYFPVRHCLQVTPRTRLHTAHPELLQVTSILP